ncbi:DUF6255 family natural product biosynthesis protein [Streptomyces sp. URMC 126]|uniref:DUF6255 family natural product biosynthesis protein n=1 Tax=Streptomyces sp. URMC 126 TaxID=3423401 RepID=UPI003F1BFBE8
MRCGPGGTHPAEAWVVARSGVATCCRCGVRRFTAYAALWREVPGRAEWGPTASTVGTGVLRRNDRRRAYGRVRLP